MNERITYLDTAKGVAIILVIIGHCYWISAVPRLVDWIYSFHMPIFFIISGYFTKSIATRTAWGVKSNFSSLLIPYIITAIAICFFDYLDTSCSDSINSFFIVSLEKIVFASGWSKGNELFATLPGIGSIWFLFALFWAKNLYSLLKSFFSDLNLLLIVILLFAFSFMSIRIIRLPFSLQAAFQQSSICI